MRKLMAAMVMVGALAGCSSSTKDAATTTDRVDTTDVETTAATQPPETVLATDVTEPPPSTDAPASSAPDTEPATDAPTTEDPTTEAPPSTDAPTTTEAATTTTVPPKAFGLVWESQVDPARVNTLEGRPTGEAEGIASAIDLVVVVDATADGDLGDECREEIDIREVEAAGATQCLVVQWRFDVAPDFRVNDNSDEGGLTCDAVVTADGKQIDQAFISSGFPGTKGNSLTCIYPFGGSGSVVHWSTGSNLVGYSKFTYTVPDALPPINF